MEEYVDYFGSVYSLFNALWDVFVGMLSFFNTDLVYYIERFASRFGFNVDIPFSFSLNNLLFDAGLFYFVIALGVTAFIIASIKNIIF